MIKKRLGLIHVYTGEGKGKTTAAIGLAMRAVGQGLKVIIIQFMKGGSYTGEYIAIRNFLPKEKIDIKQFGKRCVKEVKQFKLIGIEHGFNKEECKYFDYIRDDINCGDCRECFLDDEEQKQFSKEAFKHAIDILSSEQYDLVVLDEINNSIFKGFITVDDVVTLVQKKSPHTELVLTGRHAPKEILEMADLVTEMRNVKHYYDDGIKARRGIEY